MTKPTPRAQAAARKRKQREAIRAWIVKQTGGRITTAEGYVMELMKQNRSAKC